MLFQKELTVLQNKYKWYMHLEATKFLCLSKYKKAVT